MDFHQAYLLLGLDESASEEDIKTAYRKLAQSASEDEMSALNEAFDFLISYQRTGGAPQYEDSPPVSSQNVSANGRYRNIRQMINDGNIEQALTELRAIQDGHSDAEWNFLMGSAYYYKSWFAEALRYFQIACQLAPGNREYEAALHNLQNSTNAEMPGNPFAGQTPYGAQAIQCNCCDICSAALCANICCGCGRGCM